MDVVLEIVDRFVLDRLYATVYPLSAERLSMVLDSGFNGTLVNAHPSYTFTPASKYLTVSPTEYAYLSQWPRDNPIRQAISMFLILW
jgi:lathosterol oxidase